MPSENKSFFPQGDERKKLLRESREWAENHTGKGSQVVEEQSYKLLDSPLEVSTGSPLLRQTESFTRTFAPVTPDSDPTFKDYIQHSLMERKGKAIGVEFGGIGSKLFTGFDKGYFGKTFAVTLADHRTDAEKASAKKTEDSRGISHTVIEGDILSPEPYSKIIEQLHGEKVDLIIERMIAGLNTIPFEPYTFGKVLSAWYEMLRENGMMFVQTIRTYEPLIHAWIELVEKECKGTIELQYHSSRAPNVNAIGSSFRLVKLPGAPEKLPLLDPKAVQEVGESMMKDAVYSRLSDMHEAQEVEKEIQKMFKKEK